MSKSSWIRAALSVSLVTLFLPAVVQADPGSTDFSGGGEAYLNPPTFEKVAGFADIAKGEVVTVNLDEDTDLGPLSKATIYSIHHGATIFQPDGTLQGQINGQFTLTSADGTSTLTGIMSGTVTATLTTDAAGNTVLATISDVGTWLSTQGTGAFDNTKLSGTWTVYVSDAETGQGSVTVAGNLTVH